METVILLVKLPLFLQLFSQSSDLSYWIADYKPPYRQTPPSENRPSTASLDQNFYAAGLHSMEKITENPGNEWSTSGDIPI